MPEIITTPDGDISRRAGNTAYRLNGMTRAEVTELMRDAARTIAEQLIEAGIPTASERFRPDVGPVQIDMIVIEERVTRPEPGMRLQFEVEGDMGVTLNIKLLEFAADPAGYIRDLFAQLAPMRRNVMRLRRNKQDANRAIYRAIGGGQ